MDIDTSQRVFAVVAGFDPHMSYIKVMKAVNYLKDPAVHFIVTNEDLTFPGSNPDVVVPGAGTVSTVLRAISGRTPMVRRLTDVVSSCFAKKRIPHYGRILCAEGVIYYYVTLCDSKCLSGSLP